MTIPLLEVSFDGIFEYGQGYVALSRATDLEGLTLRSFDRSRVKAHSQVQDSLSLVFHFLVASVEICLISYYNDNSPIRNVFVEETAVPHIFMFLDV